MIPKLKLFRPPGCLHEQYVFRQNCTLFLNSKQRPYLVDKVICQLLHATAIKLHATADKLPYRPYMDFVAILQNKTEHNIKA